MLPPPESPPESPPALPALATPLAQVLERIDRLFGIAAMQRDLRQDRTRIYYQQSRIAYDRRHSARGCMHVAINPEGQALPSGFLVQPRMVIHHATVLGARRVLELGSGLGFNARHVAAALPQVEVVGMDLLPDHVAEAGRRGAAEGLGNLRFVEGRHEAFPEGLGKFDVIFAVETLCYATSPAEVARQVAAHLAPGGRFILFEPLAKTPALMPQQAEAMRLAAELYWLGVAVTRPLRHPGEWLAAFQAEGLQRVGRKDHSAETLPGIMKMHAEGMKFTDGFKGRIALRALPTYLARNAVTALLGPYLILGPGPEPSLAAGNCQYWRLVVEKPRG